MSRFTSTATLGVCGLLLASTAAQADVTAQQVWDNWADQMAIYGDGFTTAGETQSGNTLTISDVQIEISDDEATITAQLGDITLTENNDGTVTITTPESYPATIALTPIGQDPGTIGLIVSQKNLSMIVSGDPDAMTYDFSADRYEIAIDTLTGSIADEIDLETATLAATNWSGHYSIQSDDMTRLSYGVSLGGFDVDILLTEVDGNDVISGTADIADIAAFGKLALPLDLDLNADQPPFADGLAIEAGYSFGAQKYAFNLAVDGETASGAATAEGADVNIAMNYDELTYSTGVHGLDVDIVAPSALPFPIEVAIAREHIDIKVPLSQPTDGPRDARIAFELTGLAVSNAIWDLIDPQQILPRDAVTVALGLDAQVTPFFDVLDPAQQDSLAQTDVPGAVHGLQLTDLTVRGGGAEITGSGAFTFDNDDLETFDGFPRPEGQLDFAINGLNGLVDNLIEMGLIPAEDALIPRMMMGMFTAPVGDDLLTSTIEINSEGHVLANGQRLR